MKNKPVATIQYRPICPPDLHARPPVSLFLYCLQQAFPSSTLPHSGTDLGPLGRPAGSHRIPSRRLPTLELPSFPVPQNQVGFGNREEVQPGGGKAARVLPRDLWASPTVPADTAQGRPLGPGLAGTVRTVGTRQCSQAVQVRKGSAPLSRLRPRPQNPTPPPPPHPTPPPPPSPPPRPPDTVALQLPGLASALPSRSGGFLGTVPRLGSFAVSPPSATALPKRNHTRCFGLRSGSPPRTDLSPTASTTHPEHPLHHHPIPKQPQTIT